MILMNYKGTAVHPFPCPICIAKVMQPAQDGSKTPFYRVMCGDAADFIIAQYHDLAPAKMEIQRLVNQYKDYPGADHDHDVFTFMKDPYGGGYEI